MGGSTDKTCQRCHCTWHHFLCCAPFEVPAQISQTQRIENLYLQCSGKLTFCHDKSVSAGHFCHSAAPGFSGPSQKIRTKIFQKRTKRWLEYNTFSAQFKVIFHFFSFFFAFFRFTTSFFSFRGASTPIGNNAFLFRHGQFQLFYLRQVRGLQTA